MADWKSAACAALLAARTVSAATAAAQPVRELLSHGPESVFDACS